ncbi:MAG: hypothetical protein KY449_09860 [Proteobacteria bacterium]|nr:hypothetical protein [Pseudomonadota bacterium]
MTISEQAMERASATDDAAAKQRRRQRASPPRKNGENTRKAVAAVPSRPAPTERDIAAGQRAKERIKARPKRPQLDPAKGSGADGSLAVQSPHSDDGLFAASVGDAFGTTSDAFTNRAMLHLATAMQRPGTAPLEGLNTGLAIVAGVQPENEVEAMLAVQMAATHEAAMQMLQAATANATVQSIQAAGGLAVKLLRTYTAQMEALNRCRRKGEQTVRVEHVHVYEGGKAIVGNVSTGGGGGGLVGNRNQPHAPIPAEALALAPGATVRGDDAGRERMPIPCGEWEDPVPNAWRG